MAKDIQKFAHPEYLTRIADYKMIRDCLEGSRAIKSGGELYLPKLTGQIQSDYDNYKNRALFFPIASKTAVTMVGLATTEPPKVEYSDSLKIYFDDEDNPNQFTELYVAVFTEIISMGRYGILFDAPSMGGEITICPYVAENIVNWDFNDETGELQMLLLRECYTEQGQEKFERTTKTRYRHCFLEGGVYKVEVLNDDLEVTQASFAPLFEGTTIDYIPFVCFGASGVHMSCDKPPMIDISTINISHYLTSADLEWGRHLAGLPTPVISGMDSGSTMYVGGTKAWVLPNAEAKAYYMEFLGQGLQSLEKAMAEKVGLMSSMSARMIDSSSRGSEAADTVKLRYMSESAGLIHMIGAIEGGINIMYTMLCKLRKRSESAKVAFSKEVIGIGIDIKDMQVLFENYFRGGMSKETLIFNMRRVKMVDPNRSDEDEMSAIRPPEPVLDPNKPTPAVTKPKPA